MFQLERNWGDVGFSKFMIKEKQILNGLQNLHKADFESHGSKNDLSADF